MAISGRVLLLVLLGLVAVVLRPQDSTVWLWVLAVSLLAALDLALAGPIKTLVVERDPLGKVRVGEETTTSLRLSNSGGRTIRADLRDAWQPSAGADPNRTRVRLAPGERTRWQVPLQPVRRGELRTLGLTVRSWGPLGLTARQRTTQVPGGVRALHPFAARRHLPSRLARLRDLDGRAAVRVRGQGTEFDSLREYVRGDDVRSIDWRASARNRDVVVRTWQPERDRRVLILLDTSRTSAGRVDDVPRLDSAMDAALLLATLATKARDRVDFIAGDRRVRARLRSGGGGDIAPQLDEALCRIDPEITEADWSTLAAAIASMGRQRALVVLLTPLESAAIEEGLLPVLPSLTAHHRVVIASVRDPALGRMTQRRGDVDEVYAAAAAEQTLARRRRTAEVLRSLGVEVIDEDAESLPPALADHYLMLKARGLL